MMFERKSSSAQEYGRNFLLRRELASFAFFGAFIGMTAFGLTSCSTQITQFENRDKTESFNMGEAPYVGVVMVMGDSPGDKIVQNLPAFLGYIDGFADQMADPTKKERYCFSFVPASAAYTSWYGGDAFPDAYRKAGKKICNFDRSGRITDASLIKAEFRKALGRTTAGHSVQQFLGSFLRVMEFNDPEGPDAPFMKDAQGKAPDLFVLATFGFGADNTASEELLPALQQSGGPAVYTPVAAVQTPVLQASLSHPLNASGTEKYFAANSLAGISPTCDMARSLVDPWCMCTQEVTGLTCSYWLYRNDYSLMSANDFKDRVQQYLTELSGSESPKVVLATIGFQSMFEVFSVFNSAYLTAPNTRMHSIVRAFNADYALANEICDQNRGVEGQCSWHMGSPDAISGVFGLASGLAQRSLKPILLSLPVDLTKTVTVTLSSASISNQVLTSADYTLRGREVVLSPAMAALVAAERVAAGAVPTTITVNYTPAPNKKEVQP